MICPFRFWPNVFSMDPNSHNHYYHPKLCYISKNSKTFFRSNCNYYCLPNIKRDRNEQALINVPQNQTLATYVLDDPAQNQAHTILPSPTQPRSSNQHYFNGYHKDFFNSKKQKAPNRTQM